MICGEKSFKLVWRCHHILSRFLANGHLPRVSRQSLLSSNVKGDNKIKSGAVHRSSGIYFWAEENPRRSQLGDRLMKAVRPVIASNGVLYLKISSSESQSMPLRENGICSPWSHELWLQNLYATPCSLLKYS